MPCFISHMGYPLKLSRKVLMEGRKNCALQIKGLVKDCTTNLGGLFKTRSFKNIIQQNFFLIRF